MTLRKRRAESRIGSRKPPICRIPEIFKRNSEYLKESKGINRDSKWVGRAKYLRAVKFHGLIETRSETDDLPKPSKQTTRQADSSVAVRATTRVEPHSNPASPALGGSTVYQPRRQPSTQSRIQQSVSGVGQSGLFAKSVRVAIHETNCLDVTCRPGLRFFGNHRCCRDAPSSFASNPYLRPRVSGGIRGIE